ncbi:MAG: HEAT repeat domain-containing protein [Vicinamibacterales bacterium]
MTALNHSRSRRAPPLALALVFAAITGRTASGQDILMDVLMRHGVPESPRGPEGAFDEGSLPTIPIQSGAFAAPLAVLLSEKGSGRIKAAYTFGILAGRYGRSVPAAELTAAGESFVQMIVADNRKARIAGARVAGRVFATPLTVAAPLSPRPSGLVDALFALLNSSDTNEQLAAMDALGLLRERGSVPALTERYHFYRSAKKRALAGGALEALARIGDPSSIDIAKVLVNDHWAEGKDATALAVAFARERLLKDGSSAILQQALGDKNRRMQARWYLSELGAQVQ